MKAALRHLLLVVALLVSQHAALLHGLAHAAHEIALAEQGDQAPALGHDADVCAAFGALAHALGSASTPPAAACAADHALPRALTAVVVPARIGFDSRAPPLSA
jgi:hypothetical protein